MNYFLSKIRRKRKMVEITNLITLCDPGSKLDLKTGVEFSLTRKVLSAKRKELTKLGLGQKANTTRDLTNAEVDILYERKYFGIEDPSDSSKNYLVDHLFVFRISGTR